MAISTSSAVSWGVGERQCSIVDKLELQLELEVDMGSGEEVSGLMGLPLDEDALMLFVVAGWAEDDGSGG
jgi:hypothetical protein